LPDRNALFRTHQQQLSLKKRTEQLGAVDFFNLLTSPSLLEQVEEHLPEHRERLYPPTVTLSMFVQQALSADRSCQKAVNGWAAQRTAEGLSAQSVRTGGYCRARERLPMQMPIALMRETGRLLYEQARSCWSWRGRAVKLVDGTKLSMPDTPANRHMYPPHPFHKEGLGFPLARVVSVICLNSAAVLDAAMGPFCGKDSGEVALLRGLLEHFKPGDVMLADALFCDYFLIAMMQAAGVDVLFEQHGSRVTDFRRGTRLGPRDHRVNWNRTRAKPHWMSWERYYSSPRQITVREVQVDGRILVTTMTDPRRVSRHELNTLYARRWNVELDLRAIKTTLGMHALSCRTPAMNQKQMWVYLLAHNLIRMLMAQAAHTAGVDPRHLSFKHTVQMWNCWRPLLHDPIHCGQLFTLIAQVRVGQRPGRIEPRAIKRRHKTYPLLQVPRAQARWNIAVHGHP
jgi:hypothetical protein